MNIRFKIVAFAFAVVLVTTPLLAGASVGSQSLDFLASISNAFGGTLTSLQGMFSSLSGMLSKNNTSSTPAKINPIGNSITLKQGDKSVMVAVLQRTLIADGYLKAPATGIFDANTQAAVETLQKAKNLPVTGYVQIASSSIATTFSHAASSFVPIAAGTTGTNAAAFQRFLIGRGDLKIATATAYFGTLTSAAVKKFQAGHQLPQTGVIDQGTFAAMNGK
jgi:peptidoglycan hydrolase-like protein with peptidoglycan-binding domain